MGYKPLTTIIFDMDGTLANTEELHRQAFNEAFRQFDLPVEWDAGLYAELLAISGGRQRIRRYIKDNNISHPGKPLAFARKVHQCKSEIYREKLKAGHLPLRRGVLRLIREAHKHNIRMGIATSSSLQNVETLISTTLGKRGLDYFDTIVSCDLLSAQKPSPAAYQYALAALGANPENCIAIEDTSNGNRAALAAGVRTIITTHEFTTDSDFAGASLVVDDLGEPEHHFHIESGNAYDHHYVNLDLMKSILQGEPSENECAGWPVAAAGMSY